MSIPIIYFHTGNSSYLNISIKQCKKFNDHVILLGDDSNSDIDVEHHNLYDYHDDVAKFHKLYQHMSTNGHGFELTCYVRWIILANFIKKQNFGSAPIVYLDSDVMTYCDYSEKENLFEDNYAGKVCKAKRQNDYRWSASGCISYWKHDMVLKFKDYLFELYTNKIDKLKEKYQYHVDSGVPGGICDMTAIYLFSEENDIGTLNDVFDDDSTFDQNISVAENYLDDEYEMHADGFKLLHFEDGIPFCRNLLLNKTIKINATADFANTEKRPQIMHHYRNHD